jgi:hypothetical protein
VRGRFALEDRIGASARAVPPRPTKGKPKHPPKSEAGKRATVPKIPQPRGGALYAGGVPGNKGSTGRPPNWLKDWCDELLAEETTKAQVKAILSDKKHPAFKEMWKAVADRAHGKPKETSDVNLRVTLEELVAGSWTGQQADA